MYQVLYRKYRPQNFDDVCGQKTIVRLLKNSIQLEKISHAYLFAGPRGTGKTSMAKIFANVVNCENLNNFIPCGKCSCCLEKNNDIIEIDAASNNGVDEIRELRNNVNLVPTIGKYKIYIIDEVHMLTPGAFNALLKTLEEPPAHIIFILATTDPHKIPETILSRCQRLDFQKIAIDDIVTKLREIADKEKMDVSNDVLKEIALLSDGGLRDSISLLDESNIFSNGEITLENVHMLNGTLTSRELNEFVDDVISLKYKKIFTKIDFYNSQGKNFIRLTEELIDYLKQILLYKTIPDYFPEINKSLHDISQRLDRKDNIEYIYEFNKCLSEMSNTNNQKLLLELTIIKLINRQTNVRIKKDIDDTQEKYEEPKIIEKNISQIANTEDFPKQVNTDNSEENKQNIEKQEKENKINKYNDEMLSYLRKIRINNTLADFNKKKMLELQKKLENINGFLLDPTYSQYVSIIMDGTLKASSDKNLVFVFEKKIVSDDFNMNLLIVEELLERFFGKHYDVVSTFLEEWEDIKKEFNLKKKTYEYKKEDFDLKEILNSTKNNEITELFGDIIEYS